MSYTESRLASRDMTPNSGSTFSGSDNVPIAMPVVGTYNTNGTITNTTSPSLGDDEYANQGWFISPFYPVVLGIIFIAVFLFLLSFLHYRYRQRHGLPPLAYQRCFARRRRGAANYHTPGSAWGHPQYGVQGQQRYPRRVVGEDGYNLEQYRPPPPAYDPSMGPPPNYMAEPVKYSGTTHGEGGVREGDGDAAVGPSRAVSPLGANVGGAGNTPEVRGGNTLHVPGTAADDGRASRTV